MCARLLTCPLCSQPGFLTLDALRAGLISVATRPLVCPVCNEVLLGIDKLTIHLFSHAINLNSNNITELPKHINVVNSSIESPAIHNQQNTTTFQDWNVLETQTIDSNKLETNIQNNLKFSQNLQNTKTEVPILNSKVFPQNQNTSPNHAPQVAFLSDQISENEEINTIHENKQTSKSEKDSQQMLQETIKLNYATQYYSNNNIKHVNYMQNYSEIDHENTQTMKNWIQNQNCEEQMTINENLDKRGKSVENGEPCASEYNYNEQSTTMNKFVASTSVCVNVPLEKYNNYKNIQDNSSTTCNKSQNENPDNQEILSELRLYKNESMKEKTERCNICGFHFPDHNILILHKQLIHMINEKDLNIVPENLLKNYSCHLCSKIFKMRGSLMIHMRVAHMGYNLGSLTKGGQIEFILNENKYSCPTCGKQFKKEQHVMQHLKTHEAKQWECDVCSKMFTTKYFLKKHKRLHSGEMPYKCNICNKTFTFQQSYHKHRLYHKDDKPHMCTTCGRSFKELSTLHNHERIHTGEKPFECETCGKCFRQRVSYLVHRRIHTGVMPYKCTTCGKSFRYKVSQRTHKCSVQQMTNVSQTNNTDQQSVCPSNAQKISNDPCTNLQENVLEKNPSILNITNNEENKYVLIINPQGQHLLTKESDIDKTQNISNKDKKFEGYIGINEKNEEPRNIWKSDIPNSPIYKKAVETTKKIYSKNEKPLRDDTNHFFSMVMSPLENGLSSPTTEMEHLRVSSPTQKQDMFKSYDNYRCTTHEIEMNLINPNMEQNFTNTENDTNNLQTINEESLKQLLYGINEQ
ncbi:uncharacterized protein LOC100878750 [Megachile rotundata]|uniref:uncharacterized protein LOC100878750 n=1 Tax=Megachile rotundata TaxID=143995 RepID=UPI003FD50699